MMGYSNISCKNIAKINCIYYLEGRFCPDKCLGFVAKEGIAYEVEEEIKESEERNFSKKGK